MVSRTRGSRREHQIIGLLVAEGWFCMRSAGSHGPADIVALRRGMPPRFVQVKSDVDTPWHNFSPVQRRQLVDAAAAAGAEPWLVWWPPHRQLMWIHAAAWPAA